MNQLHYPVLGSPEQKAMQRKAAEEMKARRMDALREVLKELQFLANAAKTALAEYDRSMLARDYARSGANWETFLELYRRRAEAESVYWRGGTKLIVSGAGKFTSLLASRAKARA
ncbi:MAG: hypothetical protein Q8Q32_01555 [bacterium]|nr:hypothetical protein [bacterium]